MNAIVVQDRMDLLGLSIDCGQFVEEIPEQVAVFLLCLHPVNLAGAHVLRSSQITLLVLPRRHGLFLLPMAHPIQANLGIQMHIDLVFVDRDFAARQGREQPPQRVDAPGFYRGKPRTLDARTRIGPTSPNQGQGPTHGGHMDAIAGLAPHRFHQYLARPGGPTPTMFLRTGTHDAIQQSQIIGTQLLAAIIFPAVPERSFPALTEIPDDPVNRSVVNLQHPLNLPSTAAAPIVDNDEVTDPHQSLPAMAKPLQKPLLDEVTGSGQNKRHGNSSLGLVGPGSCWGFPFFYSLLIKWPL